MTKARRKKSARSVRLRRKKDTPTETKRLQRQINKLRDSSRFSKEVVDALKESESLYRSLVETSPDAVTVADLNGRIIFVSRQTLAIHGYKRPEEMLGTSVLEHVAPEDRKRAIANWLYGSANSGDCVLICCRRRMALSRCVSLIRSIA